jgi:hypothetical protein
MSRHVQQAIDRMFGLCPNGLQKVRAFLVIQLVAVSGTTAGPAEHRPNVR